MLLALLTIGHAVAEAQMIPRPILDAPLEFPPTLGLVLTATDLDGDGDQDLITYNSATSPDEVRGFENDGAANFVQRWLLAMPISILDLAATVSPVGSRAQIAGSATGDFILGADQRVVGFTSAPGFAAPTLAWSVTLSGILRQFVVADFDGNGRSDVAVQFLDGTVSYLAGNLTSAPSALPGAVTASGTVALTAYEATGDSVPELVIALPSGNLQVLSFSGSTFANLLSLSLSPEVILNLTTGDFDADGDQDLYLLSRDLSNNVVGFRLVMQVGSSVLTLIPGYLAQGPYANASLWRLVCLDDDGDGDDDIVMVGTTGTHYRTSPAGLAVSAITDNLAFAKMAVAADFDNDGREDLVVGQRIRLATPVAGIAPTACPSIDTLLTPPADFDSDGDLDLSPSYPRTIFGSVITQNTTTLNDGSGQFSTFPANASGGLAGALYSESATVVDFDSDGDLDLLVDRQTVTGVVTVLLENSGPNNFTDAGPVTLPPTTIGQSRYSYRQTGVVGSFDQDSFADMTLCTRSGSLMDTTIWFNNGSGTLTAGPTLSLVEITGIGEFTGDSNVDLVGVQASALGASPYAVVLIPGTGNGQFAPASQWQVLQSNLIPIGGTGSWLNAPIVRVADLNQDSRPDVVCANGSIVIYWLASSTGLTGATVLNHGLSTVRGLELADADGDGLMDIWTGSSVRTSILRQTSLGAWGSPQVYYFSFNSIEDFDADGDVDAIAIAGLSVGPLGRFCRGTTIEGPFSGLRRQYGNGTAGTGQFVPLLGCTAPMRSGATSSIRIAGGLGGSAGVLALGSPAAPTPLLNGQLYVNPLWLLDINLGGISGGAGEGSMRLPAYLPASAALVPITLQAGLLDPAHPFGITLSQGLEVRIGQ